MLVIEILNSNDGDIVVISIRLETPSVNGNAAADAVVKNEVVVGSPVAVASDEVVAPEAAVVPSNIVSPAAFATPGSDVFDLVPAAAAAAEAAPENENEAAEFVVPATVADAWAANGEEMSVQEVLGLFLESLASNQAKVEELMLLVSNNDSEESFNVAAIHEAWHNLKVVNDFKLVYPDLFAEGFPMEVETQVLEQMLYSAVVYICNVPVDGPGTAFHIQASEQYPGSIVAVEDSSAIAPVAGAAAASVTANDAVTNAPADDCADLMLRKCFTFNEGTLECSSQCCCECSRQEGRAHHQAPYC